MIDRQSGLVVGERERKKERKKEREDERKKEKSVLEISVFC